MANLKIMTDPKGHNTAKSIFDRYIKRDTEDFSKLPAFLVALDELVEKFGGEPYEAPPEEEDTEEPNDDGEDQDYEDDEDLHAEEAAQVDDVKRAVTAALNKLSPTSKR